MRTSARNLLASLLALLLVASGITMTAAPANAAVGDVAAATLHWGIKQSFRSYISGPIAHGGWTVAGGVSDATPFAWTGGSGAASQSGATGSVAYPGSIHFTGHDGALDLTISNVRVVQSSATAAQLVVDTRSNSLADPATFVDSVDVAFADLALAGGTPTSSATTVGFSGVPATLTAAGGTAFAGFYSAGTALDPVTFAWPVEQAPVPPTPTITVSKTSEISPAGEIVTVTGTGFGPVGTATNATRPPLAGQFGGVYVAFGKYADDWQPSSGALSATRKNGSVAWVVTPSNVAVIGGSAAGAVPINADGSFTVQLLVSKGFTGEPTTGTYGIYTYGGGSSNYAPFETATPITFSTAPVVSVSKTTGLNPLGETVTVKGYNFGPNAPATNAARPPLAGQFGGAYVAFGKYADVWKPSAAAPSAARTNGSVAWVVNEANLAAIGGAAAGGVAINEDGTFTVTLTASRDFAGEPATGTYGIYTYGGGSSTYAPFETMTPVTFTAATATTTTLAASPATGLIEGGSTTLTATVAPASAGTVAFSTGGTVIGSVPVVAGTASIAVTGLSVGDTAYTATFTPTSPLLVAPSTSTLMVTAAAKAVAAGSLTWGIKQSFRDYVSGPIAKGSVSTIGAGVSGGAFRFGQAAGGSYSSASGVGSSPYSGAVRFVGHGGILDVTIANPVVTVTSATTATLSVTVNGGGSVPFATLALLSGTRSVQGNAVSYSGVPATLTAQGAGVFAYNGSAFYTAGTALDPVSFVIGSPSSGGTSMTLASYRAPVEPPATPPATTGVSVEGGTELTEGGEYTFTASGYGAGETGILAVVYSQPTVLATDLAADSSGTVSWTGALPSGLTGEHTFTFQGSVDTGVVVTIAPAAVTATEGCAATDATLDWGFKESFRSYISGSIANGEWTVANGASYETPTFRWSDGVGTYEDESGLVSFPGSITFTGHGGILNTTVADPQLRFVDASTAVVILDVSGTTQEGEAIDAADVEFARLDLAAATTESADGTVTISGAPAELTPAGAEAFGTYPAGEAFDPVTVSFTSDCATAVVEPEAEAEPIDPQPASSGADWLLWVILAALAVVVAAVVAVLLVRRRNSVA